MRLGTIRGRHELPVDAYLLEAAEPGQAAYDAAFAAAGALADRHHYATLGEPLRIELFYTGLTEATVGALDGLAASRRDCEPVLMRWNAEGGAYEPLARGGQR